MRKLFLLSFLLAATLLSGYAQPKIPEHQGRWVHDDAGILAESTIAQLEAILKAERDSTSNQIAILIIRSLKGDDVSAYANQVFREWKLGDEKKDNGVLFLISVEDRRMRIEVGNGLEGTLTDLTSARINRNEVAPYFRRGDYDGGIMAGTIAIIQVIRGTYTHDEKGNEKNIAIPGLLKILFAIILIIYMAGRRGHGGGRYYGGRGGWMGPIGGFGGSSGSWSGGGGGFDFGGGGSSGGGGASGSW
jgi:uncharacterized protein